MPENSRRELVNGRWIETQEASLTTAHPDGRETVETTKLYTANSPADLQAILGANRQESTGSFASRHAELWREHEDIRKGFVANIKSGLSPQEAYDHWAETTREHNVKIQAFNADFGTLTESGKPKQWAREFDLEKQRTWAEHMLRRQEARRQEEQMSRGLGMGM